MMLKTFRTEPVSLWAIFVPIALLLLLAACGAPSGNAENGARWFNMNNCYACHGKNANDGRAPKIAAITRSFGSFIRFLRNPDSAIMPSFPEEKISKQNAADIYAWLKSLPE